MALSTKQKKQGAVVSAVVGALALGGVAYTTLDTSGSTSAGATSVAQAVAPPLATSSSSSSPSPSGSSSTTPSITVTAKADTSSVTDDTVFKITGKMTGAKPGAKIRLQRQKAVTTADKNPVWATLAYTTFTGSDNSFSFLVKLEDAGSYQLRILHPSDKDGPQQAYSTGFPITVTSTSPSSSSKSTSSASTPSSSKS